MLQFIDFLYNIAFVLFGICILLLIVILIILIKNTENKKELLKTIIQGTINAVLIFGVFIILLIILIFPAL